MLDILKQLLDISELDKSKDIALNHYLSKAKVSVQSHLCLKDDEMEGKFQTQIVDLAIYYYKNRNNQGIIQQSQGSRSMTIERGIPKEIAQSLPMPRIRIVGGR